MSRLADALYAIAITLWVGGMWAVGYLVAPTLFHALSDRMLAGSLAGRMFEAMAWVGMACAVYLLGYLLVRRRAGALKAAVFWIVLLMLALVSAGHFGIQPVIAQIKAEGWPREVMESAMRSRFATWHGVASAVYLVQNILGLALVVLAGRGK